MSAFGSVIIDDTSPFDKRFKSAHRTDIADTRGPLQLTVPVAKPQTAGIHGKPTWNDVRISSHGQWWRVHQTSLASAYGRTPFYEFYIDRLRPFFDETAVSSFNSIASLDKASDGLLRAILGTNTKVIFKSSLDKEAKALHMEDIAGVTDVPYYQVRQEKFGFIAGLSALDLIFNMGPESQVVLFLMNRGAFIQNGTV